jgi:hypothetical protein
MEEAMNERFKPTHITFAEGKERINEALMKVGHALGSRILTSRDREAVELCNLLAVAKGQIPNGFVKWQLPFYLDGGQFFITSAEAGRDVSEHSHDNDGVRIIMSGSVFFDDIELNAGDWMFIPKDKKYSLKIGPLGAQMCYCYCCCCAGRELNLNHDPVINPGYVRTRKSLKS